MNDDNLLSATAGYVDTLSFVSLFGLFTAHVTGNFVLIGGGIAGYGQGIFLKLMAFPAFIVGVVLSSLVIRTRNPETPMRGACMLYAMQAVLLLAFCVAGFDLGRQFSPDSWSVVVCGMIGASAMGVQNAHSRLIARPGVPNTVMTGNVTQVILDLLDLCSPRVPADAKLASRARAAKMLPAIVAFGLGAIAGALAYRTFGFLALLLPVVVVTLLAIRAWRDRNEPSR
ncbi:YoaK family protein [Caballeronia sp. INDeC2]|uniref:YoaK family protein n=1 Tax=Caballeronia sp. INDeC2 TaxID=2921747 RepID=UPI002029642D|nr:YoaK family protein [Caballeronia sp. INDeC2]